MSETYSLISYFTLVKEFNTAPNWQKDLMLRGTLLTACTEIEPAAARSRLRRFWGDQAAKRGLNPTELQTWG